MIEISLQEVYTATYADVIRIYLFMKSGCKYTFAQEVYDKLVVDQGVIKIPTKSNMSEIVFLLLVVLSRNHTLNMLFPAEYFRKPDRDHELAKLLKSNGVFYDDDIIENCKFIGCDFDSVKNIPNKFIPLLGISQVSMSIHANIISGTEIFIRSTMFGQVELIHLLMLASLRFQIDGHVEKDNQRYKVSTNNTRIAVLLALKLLEIKTVCKSEKTMMEYNGKPLYFTEFGELYNIAYSYGFTLPGVLIRAINFVGGF